MNEQEYMNITSRIDERFVNEYKEIAVNRTIRLRKKIRMAVAVAASVAVLVPATVFAAKRLTHRDKVSIFYGEKGAQMIEENLSESGFTVENGKIRLTVDSQMCDGNFTEVIYTLTALTEDAKEHIHNLQIYPKRIYLDNGEWICPGGGSGSTYGDAKTDNEVTWSFSYVVNEPYIDKSRPTRIQFLEHVMGELNEYGSYTTIDDYTYYEGIYFDLLSEPNVPTKTLYSPDGAEITLSPYGVSQLDENSAKPGSSSQLRNFAVLSTNGERIKLLSEKETGGISSNGGISVTTYGDTTYVVTGDIASGYFTFRFGTAFNVENIRGVEINGVEYLEERS